MMKKLIANLVVITVIAFSILPFLGSFRYNIVGPTIVISIIIIFMIFWRISIFPKTGYIIFPYLILGGLSGLVLGSIIGYLIGCIVGGNMLVIALVVWSGIGGGVLGVILGWLKYRKANKVNSSH